jgi:hypothetical protein
MFTDQIPASARQSQAIREQMGHAPLDSRVRCGDQGSDKVIFGKARWTET